MHSAKCWRHRGLRKSFAVRTERAFNEVENDAPADDALSPCRCIRSPHHAIISTGQCNPARICRKPPKTNFRPIPSRAALNRSRGSDYQYIDEATLGKTKLYYPRAKRQIWLEVWLWPQLCILLCFDVIKHWQPSIHLASSL